MPLLDGEDAAALERAAQTLAAGGLVGLPTETVYGLAARADDAEAVARIYEAKGRPLNHPLIVHVADARAARPLAAEWPARAERLAQAAWPGPVTLVVERRGDAVAAAAAGLPTLALRAPDHPVAQALLQRLHAMGIPGLAAPSANRYGRVSPTTAAHVVQEFGDDLLVLDGGPCREGIESSIVDVRGPAPVLLRPGTTAPATLRAWIGEAFVEPAQPTATVSGSHASHYAPTAVVVRCDDGAALAVLWRAELQAAASAGRAAALGVWAPGAWRKAMAAAGMPALAPGDSSGGPQDLLSPQPQVHWRDQPDDPVSAAHRLFADLRALDALGPRVIAVASPPEGPAWAGVRDRLQRAAAPRG